ncbi:MAG: LysR family transcriptional regulator [Rhodobacter sp.]|nr:LysR family transcriptional regulator [Paracoccaceae bacterium]MCB1410380.1 LysR family transcriptional regulator [Paracoccaceae bacterium]MCC0079836.1 LysR family transcriptional regulator [Rhodobacter sp.]
MPYLESIKVFVRVVELGSITSGGRDQRLTPAVASKRIKELETKLGTRLLNRTTRKLVPTEAGRVFYEHARSVVSALEDAEASLAGFEGRPRGTIRVTAPLGVGRRIIAPLVPRFCDLFPEVDIRLRLSDRRVDMFEDEQDVAFFLGTPQDSTLKMRKIADCPRLLCATPDYLARHGTPRTPQDLLDSGQNCLLLRFPRSPEYFWVLDTPDGPQKLEVAGRFDADTHDVLLDWALDGRGIAMKPRFEVARHLETGTLVEILPDTPPQPAVFGCLYPHRKLQDPKIQRFLDYMVRHCRAAMDRA